MERSEIAMTPAKSPGPTMETNSKAQIRELMYRDWILITKNWELRTKS